MVRIGKAVARGRSPRDEMQPSTGGFPRATQNWEPVRKLDGLDALLCPAKAGCHCHLLPRNFPPHKTVYHAFAAWNREAVLAARHDRLRAFAREQAGRRSRPTAAIIDGQTVRSPGLAAEAGYDAGKKTKGRQRHIMPETLGRILSILATPADRPEHGGAKPRLDESLGHHGWLRKLWVDGGLGS